MDLRELRLQAGLSQTAVAKVLEVDQAAVSNWEAGRYRPVKRFRKPLAKLYKVTLEELVEAFPERREVKADD